jgi:hypothetical protein
MAASTRPAPSADNEFLASHAHLLIESHRRATGRELLDSGGSPVEQARALFEAPFVVASHGTEADPVFNYGNRAALELFEMSWEQFTTMPSRLSAEPVARDERARLLARVAQAGFIDDYQGVRVSRTGRRFFIQRATVWSVLDADGANRGQAVTFRDWRYL